MPHALIVDLARNALLTALMLAGPLLLVALGVGLLISIVQAVTSIQEQTLSFVPKLFAVGAAFLVGAALDDPGAGEVHDRALPLAPLAGAVMQPPVDLLAPAAVGTVLLFGARVGGLLLVAPVFSAKSVPMTVRTALLVVLTWLLAPVALRARAARCRLTPTTAAGGDADRLRHRLRRGAAGGRGRGDGRSARGADRALGRRGAQPAHQPVGAGAGPVHQPLRAGAAAGGQRAPHHARHARRQHATAPGGRRHGHAGGRRGDGGAGRLALRCSGCASPRRSWRWCCWPTPRSPS